VQRHEAVKQEKLKQQKQMHKKCIGMQEVSYSD
jgi:hypothetical protein